MSLSKLTKQLNPSLRLLMDLDGKMTSKAGEKLMELIQKKTEIPMV
jgi:hypothetical protein